jgi:hypothetical protein
MRLTHLLLTEIHTAPLAPAYYPRALPPTLFVFRIAEARKLFVYLKTPGVFLKTTVRPLPLCSQLTQARAAHPALLLA